jgi:signal transduction histidine kinase
LLGNIQLLISLKLVGRLAGTLWRTTAGAAAFSVVTLLLVLSYLLRKTIENDRKLKLAETANVQLTTQLHEAERQLMNTEKLAVMGQLTASFAHEIGTPLNAIGGHLQLLGEELEPGAQKSVQDRMEIINGQLSKIEQIVKGFLQSTAKPSSQKQLVDVNLLVDRTLGILRPRIDSMGIEVRRSFNRHMGPLRVVPIEIEQILVNLVNNSLDSMKAKADGKDRVRLYLELETDIEDIDGKPWARISVYDTGEGIEKSNIRNVLKPFFTTKRPGEGTGLGLTISQQLVHMYGGRLDIDSKKGAWARVTLRIPYQP